MLASHGLGQGQAKPSPTFGLAYDFAKPELPQARPSQGRHITRHYASQ